MSIRSWIDRKIASMGYVKRPLRIAVLGDSLSTQNYLLAPAWPTILEQFLRQSAQDVQVFNCSVAGHNFYRAQTVPIFGTKTALDHLLSLKPDIVILSLGYNDAISRNDGRDLSSVKSDATTALRELSGIPVLYFGMQPPDELDGDSWWRGLYSTISGHAAVKASTSIRLSDIYKVGGGLPDGLHLNGAGAQFQAAQAVTALHALGWIPDLLMNGTGERNKPNEFFANTDGVNGQCVRSSLSLP